MVRSMVAGMFAGVIVVAIGFAALSLILPIRQTIDAIVPVAPENVVQIAPIPHAEVMLLPDGAIVVPAGDDTLPAIKRFAAPEPHHDGPMFTVVMVDIGEVSGATLASMRLPLTIALDPRRGGVTQDSARYRAAGLEVAVLVPELAPDMDPVRLASAMEGWRNAVPQAVAFVEYPEASFQNNQSLSQQIVVGLKAVGEGLLTQNPTGNPADELARMADVPHVGIWGVLDRQSEAIAAALDAAESHAIRSGGVTVMLRGEAETIGVLAEWAARPHPHVVFAPTSALMRR